MTWRIFGFGFGNQETTQSYTVWNHILLKMHVEKYTLIEFYAEGCPLIPEITELILVYSGILRIGRHSVQWIIYL